MFVRDAVLGSRSHSNRDRIQDSDQNSGNGTKKAVNKENSKSPSCVKAGTEMKNATVVAKNGSGFFL